MEDGLTEPGAPAQAVKFRQIYPMCALALVLGLFIVTIALP